MNFQLVFSKPPESLSQDEYDSWYEEHIAEILEIPGFVAAQRYRIVPAVDAAMPYSYLVVYELDGDPDVIMGEMDRLGLISKDTYIEKKQTDSDGPALPDWWDEVRFASWNCVSIGDRVEDPS